MKIQSSNVSMQSERSYFSYEKVESASVSLRADEAATIDLSDESKSKAAQLKDIVEEKKKSEKEEKKAHKENEKKHARDMMDNYLESLKKHKVDPKNNKDVAKTPEEIRLETLKRIIELLRRGTGRGPGAVDLNEIKKLANDMDNISESGSSNVGICNSGTPVSEVAPKIQPQNGRQSVWVQTSVQSSFYFETENTAFQSQGTVKTTDGREINFNVTLEMSRTFCQTFESFSQQKYFVCDPLVINADAGFANVEDQKFLFDIDADGKEEEISELSAGSGYLALDKNGDGEINDGSELFGTKSGDGFKDLAAYDDDGNGWIDENDAIFNKLKLWTKDEKGNKVLIDLKKADVGAIFLGKTDTQFSLNNNATNHTNGYVRSTGVFLKESGGVGTVQHVDLTL